VAVIPMEGGGGLAAPFQAGILTGELRDLIAQRCVAFGLWASNDRRVMSSDSRNTPDSCS